MSGGQPFDEKFGDEISIFKDEFVALDMPTPAKHWLDRDEGTDMFVVVQEEANEEPDEYRS